MTITKTEVPSPLNEVEDGDEIDRVLLARDIDRRSTRRGSPFLRLVLADRGGSLPGVMWDPPSDFEAAPVFHVIGKVGDHARYGRQIVVSRLDQVDPGDVNAGDLITGPGLSAVELEMRLDTVISGVVDPSLSLLLDRLLGGEGSLRRRFCEATAAKYNHHAYPGGLLEHSLQVAETVAAAAEVHVGVDRDLAVTGALLHDIGKLEAYGRDPFDADLTAAGRLEGEIPLGYFLVRTEIERIAAFPVSRARALLHVILSHHGRLEHGSPVVPGTREATLVHAMDKLSGLMGGFDRLEREASPGQEWSRHDQVIGTSAWLGGGQ